MATVFYQCKVVEETMIESPEPFRILALGDSYTIGESVSEDGRWPVQLAKALELKLNREVTVDIIAKTGWRTDQLREAVSGTHFSHEFDLVTLLIGVNNQYQGKDINDYPNEFKSCLDQAIALAPALSDVVVVSIPDYAYTPFGQTKDPSKISSEIDAYNAINQEITEERSIKYVPITDITREGLTDPKLVAPDGLHPSGECYGRFVPRIIKTLNL